MQNIKLHLGRGTYLNITYYFNHCNKLTKQACYMYFMLVRMSIVISVHDYFTSVGFTFSYLFVPCS